MEVAAQESRLRCDSILDRGGAKPALEMLAEARDVAIADTPGDAEPHGLDMAARGILGSDGVAERDRFDEVLVLVAEKTSVREAFVEGPAMEGALRAPDAPPCGQQLRHIGEGDDAGVQFFVRSTECRIIAFPGGGTEVFEFELDQNLEFESTRTAA